MKLLEWILTIGLGLVFAGCFYGVGATRLIRQKDYISLLFFFVAHWSFHPLFKALGAFPRQRDVLTRERASDSYPISAWFLANLFGEWAVAWAHPLAFYAICWPIAGIPAALAPSLYVITMINYEVSMGVGNLVAAIVFDSDTARMVAVVLMAFNMLAGGFFVNLANPSLPSWLSSVRHISYFTYTFGEYVSRALPAKGELDVFKATLAGYSFDIDGHLNVAMLCGLGVALRLAGFALIVRSRQLRFS